MAEILPAIFFLIGVLLLTIYVVLSRDVIINKPGVETQTVVAWNFYLTGVVLLLAVSVYQLIQETRIPNWHQLVE